MMELKYFLGGTRMGPLGWQEMMVIFVLALLIFGPKKLPELGKTIGKAMTGRLNYRVRHAAAAEFVAEHLL